MNGVFISFSSIVFVFAIFFFIFFFFFGGGGGEGGGGLVLFLSIEHYRMKCDSKPKRKS